MTLDVGPARYGASTTWGEIQARSSFTLLATQRKPRPKAPYGDTVFLKLKLRNTSYKPIRFFTGGWPPHDFIITTADGEEVWNWQCARVRALPLIENTLLPGQKLEFVGEWEQVDSRGEPVPAGDYLIRGVLDMETPERLVTPPHELRVFQ